jgi:hypothetical protein
MRRAPGHRPHPPPEGEPEQQRACRVVRAGSAPQRERLVISGHERSHPACKNRRSGRVQHSGLTQRKSQGPGSSPPSDSDSRPTGVRVGADRDDAQGGLVDPVIPISVGRAGQPGVGGGAGGAPAAGDRASLVRPACPARAAGRAAPAGHPDDFVLAEAVRAGVLSVREAVALGETRVGGVRTLLRVGFTEPTGHPAAGALLPHRLTLAAPPHAGWRSVLCGTVLRVAPTGGWPASALWRPDIPRSRRTGTAATRRLLAHRC